MRPPYAPLPRWRSGSSRVAVRLVACAGECCSMRQLALLQHSMRVNLLAPSRQATSEELGTCAAPTECGPGRTVRVQHRVPLPPRRVHAETCLSGAGNSLPTHLFHRQVRCSCPD
jgi:hypothetical protein